MLMAAIIVIFTCNWNLCSSENAGKCILIEILNYKLSYF